MFVTFLTHKIIQNLNKSFVRKNCVTTTVGTIQEISKKAGQMKKNLYKKHFWNEHNQLLY